MTGGRCVITGHLIAPGTVKRMLCDSHQFHMGIAHIFYIFYERMGKLLIAVETVLGVRIVRVLFPGTRMHLINAHRLFVRIFLGPLRHPGSVCPAEFADICHLGGISGTKLGGAGKRICLIKLLAFFCQNIIFVETAFLNSGHKSFPDSQRLQPLHGSHSRVPAVKISDYMDVFRMGRPDGKINALFALSFGQMRAQLFVNVIMGSLTEKILIQLTDLKNFLFFGCCPLCRRLFLRCRSFLRRLFFFYRCCFPCSFLCFFHNPLLLILRMIFFQFIYVVRFFYIFTRQRLPGLFLPRSLFCL